MSTEFNERDTLREQVRSLAALKLVQLDALICAG